MADIHLRNYIRAASEEGRQDTEDITGQSKGLTFSEGKFTSTSLKTKLIDSFTNVLVIL